MKKIALSTLILVVATAAFGQTNQKETSKKLPPMSMLPKDGEVKQMYELPEKMDYEIYNGAGEKIASGHAAFIDYTSYKKGTYFIRYGNKTDKFTKG